jgi:outer membrane receptor protein involved in Fe transport
MSADASGTTYRGNLGYKPNENTLLYAGWSQGFRLGKPQPGLPTGLCDLNSDGIVDGSNVSIGQTQSLESDNVDNYELGAKISLLDRRLMIAADVFRIDWTGVPIRVLAPGTVGSTDGSGCGLAYTANAGDARSNGVELQANFNVTDNFRIDVGGSRIHARLVKDVPALSAPSGSRLPGSPEVNANLSAQYDFVLGESYKAYARIDTIYVGSFYGDLLQTPSLRAGGYTKIDASARVSIRSLTVDLFVRNLTNIDDFTFRGISGGRGAFFGYRAQPRTVGLQLGYDF